MEKAPNSVDDARGDFVWLGKDFSADGMKFVPQELLFEDERCTINRDYDCGQASDRCEHLC